MLYKAILKGIDNDIYGLLSFMYDDMVNKISKQDTPYTMAEGLEAKNKTKAMKALKELLAPIKVGDKTINIGEYIKNKPYLNRIVYNRKYTEGTKTESKGDSIQVQKLKLLSKYANKTELEKAYKELKFEPRKLDKNKKLKTEAKYLDTLKLEIFSPSAKYSKLSNRIEKLKKELEEGTYIDVVPEDDKVPEKLDEEGKVRERTALDIGPRVAAMKSNRKRIDLIYDKQIKILGNEFKFKPNEKEKEEGLKETTAERKEELKDIMRALKAYQRFENQMHDDSVEFSQKKAEEKRSRYKEFKDKKIEHINKLNKELRELKYGKDKNIKTQEREDKKHLKMEEITVKVLNEKYFQDKENYETQSKLFSNLFDGNKPKKGLLYGDKAKAQLKEIGKVGTPKSTDSPLLQHLNSKTPKAKGAPVAPNETNFDILVFDLRRTMGMILNAFGGEYKEVVGRILEELKKSLKAEFERIKSTDKDFYGADRTLRDTKVDESVKEQTATTLNFLKKLNSIISSKITKKDVIDTFEDSTISKQKLMSMIVNPPSKTYTVSDSGERTKKEATYRNYLLPRKGSEGELIFSKKKITGKQFDKFEVLESKLTAKKLKEIRVALIAVGIQRYIPTKTKGKLRQRLEEYSSNLENIMILFNRKVEAALQLKLDFESKVDKTKTKLQRNLSQGEVPDSFIAPTKEFIASIEEMFSAKNKENELIDELSEMIEEIRAKIGKPMKPREREEPEQSPKEESKEIVEELDVKHSKLVELQEKQIELIDVIDAYREAFREMLSDGIEEKHERAFIEEHKRGVTEFKNEIVAINAQIRAIVGAANQIKLVVDKYGIPTPESIKDIRAKKETGREPAYDIDRVIEGLKQVKRILGAKEMMPKDKR